MPGRLVVICGPMFAGKSTALLDRARGAEAAGRRVLAVKPARDDRYDASAIVTHAGEQVQARALHHAGELLSAYAEHPGGPPEVVIIDEAHFFGDELIAPVLALLAGPGAGAGAGGGASDGGGAGCEVILAGLERDHRGEPFAPMPRLLCEADEVVKLTGRCARCGGAAIHSQRLVASRERIVVGGAEAYEPRCRACFVPGA
jgi:thymidine kinase